MTAGPEDQVPRKLAYEKDHPGVSILPPDPGDRRWRAVYDGTLLPVRTLDLPELLDKLEEAGDPRAAGACPLTLPWRPGRQVNRHMYAQLGDGPDRQDPYVGTVETAELAAHICSVHNERLGRESVAGEGD
jgi:hypothetical protein